MELLVTQVLIILVIRTRRSPLVSRPLPLLADLPLSSIGPLFGFVQLPPAYFAFLAERIKRLFYRRFGHLTR